MPTVKEIISYIEDTAPLHLQESYDNAGLICGDYQTEVQRILLTIDITEEVIEEAIREKCNLIISHHPLTLQGIKNILPDNYIKRCLIKAIKHDVNMYSAHTNMDAVFQGVSGKMADKLNLINRKILQPSGRLFSLQFYTPRAAAEKVRHAIFEAGAGCIGKYNHCSFNMQGEGTFQAEADAHPYVGKIGELHTEAEIKTEITVPEYMLKQSIDALCHSHPYEEPVWNIVCLKNTNPLTGFGMLGELETACDSMEFLQQIKTIFHCQALRYTNLCKPQVKKIAVCGGSGAFLTHTAIARQADIFITGDYKYHDYFTAENHIIIADIGHYESEQFTKDIFYELLTKKISKFAVQFSKVKTNPINYL